MAQSAPARRASGRRGSSVLRFRRAIAPAVGRFKAADLMVFSFRSDAPGVRRIGHAGSTPTARGYSQGALEADLACIAQRFARPDRAAVRVVRRAAATPAWRGRLADSGLGTRCGG